MRNSKREGAVHLRAAGTWGAGLAAGLSGRLQMFLCCAISVLAEVPGAGRPQALARLPTQANSAAGQIAAAEMVSEMPQKQNTVSRCSAHADRSPAG